MIPSGLGVGTCVQFSSQVWDAMLLRHLARPVYAVTVSGIFYVHQVLLYLQGLVSLVSSVLYDS